MKKIILKHPNPDNPQIKEYVKAVERGLKFQHVFPAKNRWVVKTMGSSRASGVFSTQETAIQFGKKLAKKQKTELIIHREDGRIRERNSFEE